MPTGNEKMSDVILKFAAPLTDEAPNDQAFRFALEFAIIVWNMSFVPYEERRQHLNQIVSQFYREGPDEAWSIINLLLDRKEKHFSRYRRIIANVKTMHMNHVPTGRDAFPFRSCQRHHFVRRSPLGKGMASPKEHFVSAKPESGIKMPKS